MRWFAMVAGLLVVLLAVGRIVDLPVLKTRRWPGSFASATRQQRQQIFALLPLGLGIAALGAGQLAIDWSRPLATVLLVVALVVTAAAAVVYARALVAKQ
jgi:hypothetical protein